MSSPAPTRKRTRSQIFDEDELSPEKGSTTTPLTSVKKRRLNANGTSPAGGITGSLKRTIGGIFGWGKKEKENLMKEAEEEDELASGKSLEQGKSKNGAPEKDIYDFEGSEPEVDSLRMRKGNSEKSKSTPTPNKTKPASERRSAKSRRAPGADEIVQDIWEVPDDDAVERRPSRNYTSSAERAKALLAPAVQDEDKETPTVRSPGRPKKSRILKDDMKLSKIAVRERLVAAMLEQGDEGEEEAVKTPKRRKSGRAKEDSPAQSLEVVVSAKRLKPGRSRKEDILEVMEPQPASSIGKRGRPRRASIDITDSPREVPKGILTPSKSRPGRPRKSVTFGEGELDLGFKDIPGKTSQTVVVKLHGNAAEATEDEPEEQNDSDEDDVACAICTGRKSTKKNPIILCDGENCEYAAHKSCEKLPVIPEEDWFCTDCRSSLELEVEEEPEEEIESDGSDDIACAVCSGLDSKAKNPIIMCDGEDCDYAVHIKCCQLSAVPRGKWLCEECDSKDQDNVLFPQLDDGLALTGSSNNLPDIEGFEKHLQHMQRTLLNKLTGQKRIRLRGYDEEMKKVRQVVEQTVLAGEGNSMLVIGARGSGKTTVSYIKMIPSNPANAI
jgi:origin recognition complex subunit 4